MSKLNRRKFLQNTSLSLAGLSIAKVGKVGKLNLKTNNEVLDAAFTFLYYPSLHKLEIDLSSIPLLSIGRKRDITAIVRQKESGEEVVRQRFTVTGEGGVFMMDTPKMQDGKYELSIDFSSLGGEVKRTFLHKNFEWLGNDLGKSNVVYPPFEPIKIKENEVQVVLRTYKMNGFGLWDNVISEGEELLAAPIMLHLLTDQGEASWKFSDEKWITQAGHAATYQSKAESSGLSIESTSTIEFDGCMKVELNLIPGKGTETIQQLWLEIPLKNNEAPLFHYATLSGIRRNYAGATPYGGKITWMSQPDDTDPPKWPQGAQPPLWKAEAGSDNGIIWTCRDIRPWEHLYKTDFVPYIWLGGGNRGIAWFGDSPRGYLLDSHGTMQRIERDGDILRLRVDLINKPGLLKEPRKIVFGIQASPTRPMPDDLRSNVAIPALPIGDMVCWGGHECADKYPDDRNFQVVDEIIKVRKTGELKSYVFRRLSNERSRHFKVMGTHTFTVTWLNWVLDVARVIQDFFTEAKHAANGVIKGAVLDGQRYHVDGGSDAAIPGREVNRVWETVSEQRLYPDRIANKIYDAPLCIYFEEHASNIANVEWAVYQDEWRGRRVYASRSKVSEMPDVENNFQVGRQGFPESYRDFALWYANEWMKRGVSIYIDNIYPKIVDNPLTSAAFIDDDGDIQPSASLWDLREYHRRIWVLVQEWNLKDPAYKIMVTHHTTNTLMLPVHTWNDATLDLEWWAPGSPSDGLEKGVLPFSPEFLLAESVGHQTGSYRHVLRSILSVSPKRWFTDHDPEIVRMEWGMRMVHEAMRWLFPYENYAVFEPARTLEKKLWEFGYGTNDCRVTNYWQSDPAILIKDSKIKWLLLSKKNDQSLLLVLQSYYKESTTADILIDEAKLGFSPAAKAYDIEKAAEVSVEQNNNKNLNLKVSLNGQYGTCVLTIGV